jgi:beta-lactamase class A
MINFVPTGEERDTTSPRAMAQTVARFVHGGLLGDAARDTLVLWMVETKTGARRLRAGLPPEWKAGNKTGTGYAKGMVGKTNDVAAVWPVRGQPPVIVAAYRDSAGEVTAIVPEEEALLASVGRLTAAWMRGQALKPVGESGHAAPGRWPG